MNLFLFQLTCKCPYNCRNLSHSHRQRLFEMYRALPVQSQRAYIQNLVSIIPVIRRYRDNCENPETSRHQNTALYYMLDEESQMKQVCRGTLISTFGLTKSSIETIIKRKANGSEDCRERRGGKRNCKYSEKNIQEIHDTMNSIPKDESRYGRQKTNKIYLSYDLNITKLFDAFKENYPNNPIKIDICRKIFKRDFSSYKFHLPTVDTCHTCDKFF